MDIVRQIGRWIRKALVALLLLPIVFYQRVISPFTPPACRFTPTCSEYAATAIERFGAARGSYLAARRVLRCNPWSKGGYDPVPPRAA